MARERQQTGTASSFDCMEGLAAGDAVPTPLGVIRRFLDGSATRSGYATHMFTTA